MNTTTKPTHRKHTKWHNYKSRSIYHITMVVSDRQQVLGKIIKTGATARCEVTPLGAEISQCITKIETVGAQQGRQLQVLAKIIMPDHIHFVLYVKEPMNVTLGWVIHGFKMGCNKALKRLIEQQKQGNSEASSCSGSNSYNDSCLDKATQKDDEQKCSPLMQSDLSSHETDAKSAAPQYQRPEGGYRMPNVRITSSRMLNEKALFEPDYDETILLKKGQLKNMIDYVHNNPEHRWQRQQKPGWLLPQRNIVINNQNYDAIGNINLLALNRKQVWIHSVWDEKTRKDYMNQCIIEARQGKALVSPFISDYEKQVRDYALKEGHSIVQIVNNGFGELEQCPGNLYSYCCQGQVLLIVPAKYPRIEKPSRISRQQCMVLNALATNICLDKANRKNDEENEERKKNEEDI